MTKDELRKKLIEETDILKFNDYEIIDILTGAIIRIETDRIKKENERLELENNTLRKQLREISEYCQCVLKYF